MANNIVTATFNASHFAVTPSIYRYNYGNILAFEGIENLPTYFEVHFANRGDTTTTPWLGQDGQVTIPDDYLQTGKQIVAYIYLHETAADGETVYKVLIPVRDREEPEDVQPTPEQQTALAAAIYALNTETGVATEAAADAGESAEDAEAWAVGERGGVPVEADDPTYENNAKYYAEQAGSGLDYTDLTNKPSINGVTLQGNKTAEQLGLAPEDIIAVQTETPSNDTKLWVNPDGTQSVMVPTMGDFDELTEDVGDLKSAINNVQNLSSLDWVLGTLTPGTGAQSPSTTRIVSPYIKVSAGEKIVVEGNADCLIVYGFGDDLQYLSDSPWTAGNVFTVPTTLSYARILVRKNNSNATISASEVAEQSARCSILQKIPADVYNYSERFISAEPLNLEIGGMNAGIPSTGVKNYVRPADFVKANKGDILTIVPSFTWASVAVYLYSANTTGSYLGQADFPTALYSGRNYSYVFEDDCYFKIRAANANYSVLTDSDVKAFEDCTEFTHYFNYADFELYKAASPIALDYDDIASAMGDFNIAIQTDTHMSKYTCFGTGDTSYSKSDFGAFKSALLSIQKIGFDCYANLGDIVRGYPADTDWEMRETFDTIATEYDDLETNKFFVIGNHDDGCAYYYSTAYNDKRSIYNVLYPSEQFNRITKYGKNQGGILNYYFADINNAVRIITLYQRDFDYSTTVPQIESFAIGSTQLDWFANTALNTDLPVIVLTHASLVTELYANGGTGFADAATAIQNFKQNGGTVIAVLSGHKHEQASATVNGINHIVFANGYTWFEKVSVDFANRQIKCTAINKTLDEITMTY